MNRRAFTLIELLIVVSILALLVSILLPALSHAREITRAAICMSNLRHWGVGLNCYMAEYNGYIPHRGQGIQKVTQIDRTGDWFNALPRYVNEKPYSTLYYAGCKPAPGDKSMFICPSAEFPAGWNPADNFFPYAMNIYLSPWNTGALTNPYEIQHNIRRIRWPNQLVFMADAYGPCSSTLPVPVPAPVSPTDTHRYAVIVRHSGRANLVFVDGHVETQTGISLGCNRPTNTLVPESDSLRWKTGIGDESTSKVPYGN